MTNRTRVLAGLAALAILGLPSVAVFAFVPSCEEELAQAYPPALMADLGACNDPAAREIPESKADLNKFAQRLNGTWKLRSRTLQGLPASSENHFAELYFDVGIAKDGRVEGKALLIDHAVGGVAAASGVAGIWSMSASLNDDGHVVMNMTTDPIGPYAVAGHSTEAHRFFEDHEVFASIIEESTEETSWDRVVVMENSLTYVSCERGTVERYTKLSNQKPVVEGVSLDEYLNRFREDDETPETVASLGSAAGR